MVRKTRKVNPLDNLSQMSIKKYFTTLKGPAKFDSKPCFTCDTFKVSAKRSMKRSSGGEVNSDVDDDFFYGGRRRRNNKQRKKIRPLSSDDDEAIFVQEYSIPDDDNSKLNDEKALKRLSPQIILHTCDGDILFTSKRNTVGVSDTASNSNKPSSTCIPSKSNILGQNHKASSLNKLSSSENNGDITKDSFEVTTFSASTSFINSTPMKQMSITKSKKQSTELQKFSRVLQMNSSTSADFSKLPEFISTDFLSLNDTTLVCDQRESVLDGDNNTVLNYVTAIELNQNTSWNAAGENVDIFADTEYSEKRRSYHLSLIDKIVKNAKKHFLINLLLNSDKHMLRQYENMPDTYKFLCCKLFTYISKWHNLHKFVNKLKLTMNSPDIFAMYKYLEERNVISKDLSSETSMYLLDLLEADDVKDIHKSLRLKSKKQTKPILMKSILEHANQQTTLTSNKSLDKIVREKICDKLGLCIKLSDCFYNMFYKIHLLYSFTNPELGTPSDLYLYMAQIKNEQICIPSFECEDKTFFKDAEEFSRFSRACSLKNELLREFDRKKKSDNMKELCRVIYTEFKKFLNDQNQVQEDNKRPSYLKRFTAGNKYASALSFACKQMTTECPHEVNSWLELLLSQDVFCQQKRGFWYCQHSMVLHRYLKDQEKAAETLVIGLRDKSLSVIDLTEITYKAKGYCKKKKTPTTTQSVREELLSLLCSVPDSNEFPSIVIDAIAVNSNQPTVMKTQYKVMNLNGDVNYVSVEQVALNHYVNEKGFLKGVHCEGSLMATIFAVLFWDILYSPTVSKQVPFAFISELQYLPLDFSTREFYYSRQVEIEDRLDNIKHNWSLEYLEDYVDTIWNNLSCMKSLIVRDIVADSVELSNIILCIGREVVSEVCKRLVEHFRERRAGMPDLFLWNAVNKKSKFVEVKGPGDKLSTKQKLWLQFLRKIGADVEVCHVHPVGSNRSQKYKKQPKGFNVEL